VLNLIDIGQEIWEVLCANSFTLYARYENNLTDFHEILHLLKGSSWRFFCVEFNRYWSRNVGSAGANSFTLYARCDNNLTDFHETRVCSFGDL